MAVEEPESPPPNGSFVNSTEMMQVINYEEEFNSQLGSFLEKNNISQLGFDYNVTAIMGPQSSGKSTLLNLLFGTSFRTMDSAQGRYQVTQGVWLGRDDTRGIVVMDLEGTDSRERGEDAASFERKSALFALALAEVLIVNVWTQDVGRFNAANLSLLKTVMELDLQLFFSGDVHVGDGSNSPRRQGHKTRLLFVLRDHVSTPVEALEATLRMDVNNIWDSIAKPEVAAGTAVTDYFDLSFFALPHKVLMNEQFVEKASELRNEFMEGDMFLDEYRREVAADGFATYAESVWSTIRDNKELDIPTQKEMLATVRCEQIARDVLAIAEEKLAPLEKKLLQTASPSQVVPDLFKILAAICDEATKQYDEGAFRYAKVIAKLKGQDLREKLGNDSKALFDTQLSIASDNALKNFDKQLFSGKESTQSTTPWKDWGLVSSRAKSSTLEEFDAACYAEELESSDHPLAFTESSIANARTRLSQSLDIELSRATDDMTLKARNYCLEEFDRSFKPNLSMVLDKAEENVWERASEVATVSWEQTKKDSMSIFGSNGLGLEGDVLEETVEDQLKPECLDRTLKTIRDTVGSPSSFLLRMTKKFDDLFRFDERGIPRTFGPDEDLESLFMESRESAEKLADLLGEIKLEGPLTTLRQTARSAKESVSRKIFEAHHKNELREKLHRQAGAVFMEARRSQEAAKVTTKVPVWLFGLLLFLGWNEIMTVLRNPILLLLTLILVPIGYVVYSQGDNGMLVPAIRAMVGPMMRQAQGYVDRLGGPEIQGPPPPPVRPAIVPNGVGSNEARKEAH